MDAHTVNDLFLTNVRVPAANGVGQIRQVWNHLVRGLSVERLIIALSMGTAPHSLHYVPQWEQWAA